MFTGFVMGSPLVLLHGFAPWFHLLLSDGNVLIFSPWKQSSPPRSLLLLAPVFLSSRSAGSWTPNSRSAAGPEEAGTSSAWSPPWANNAEMTSLRKQKQKIVLQWFLHATLLINSRQYVSISFRTYKSIWVVVSVWTHTCVCFLKALDHAEQNLGFHCVLNPVLVQRVQDVVLLLRFIPPIHTLEVAVIQHQRIIHSHARKHRQL